MDLIDEVAKLWIELGGDSEGVAWSWRRLKERVEQLEAAQHRVQSDGFDAESTGSIAGDVGYNVFDG